MLAIRTRRGLRLLRADTVARLHLVCWLAGLPAFGQVAHEGLAGVALELLVAVL
jgi:hypothetical protein